jgi:hypothetical protein
MNSNEKSLEKEEENKRFTKIANEKYTIVDKIGQGSFGEVFVCMFVKNDKQNFRSVKMVIRGPLRKMKRLVLLS